MVGHVARIQLREIRTGFWYSNCNKSDHLEDLCTNGRMIWKQNLKQEDKKAWTGFIWHRTGLWGRPLWTW